MVLSTVVVVLLVLVGYLNNTILAGTMSGCLISAQEQERRQANEGVNEREDEDGLLQMNYWRLLPQLHSHKTTTCPI